MSHPAVVQPLQQFLNWCDKLGIGPQSARQFTLKAAIRSQQHESVLFFLCGRDYIYNATDDKLLGIVRLFIGAGTPYEINISSSKADEIGELLLAPAVSVKTEGGAPHVFGAYARGHEPGVRRGGVANYNLGTQAIVKACAGLGPNFLRDLVKQVNDAKEGIGVSSVKDESIFGYMQDMRNHARRFWMNDLAQIGL